jgi:PIN domain nuclease of toxin-antitoxin system
LDISKSEATGRTRATLNSHLHRKFPLVGIPRRPGDPADRLIVATAMTLGLPLMTVDKKIIEWNKAHSAIQILNL